MSEEQSISISGASSVEEKLDCRKCCFNAISKIMSIADAKMHCIAMDQPFTYYVSDNRPDFMCKYFVDRGSMLRVYSKAALSQYKELHPGCLSNDYHMAILGGRWENYHKVVDYGMSKIIEAGLDIPTHLYMDSIRLAHKNKDSSV